MEWLFLLLFYALSVYLKNRKQKAAHKEIEDDPDWDPEEKPETVKGVDLLEKFLTSQGLIEQEAVTKRKAFLLEQEAVSENSGPEENSKIDFELVSEEQVTPVPEDLESFNQDKIERREKDRRSIDRDHKILKPRTRDHEKQKQIFDSPNSLKRGIIIKEILDKPLALRKNR
jgi:hypothetical protein